MQIFKEMNFRRALCTRSAVIILGVAAAFSTAVLPLHYVDLNYGSRSPGERALLTALGSVGALAVAVLFVGMWLYWLTGDNSKRNARIIWFLVMLVGLPVGAIPYYVFVYLPNWRKGPREKKSGAKR